MVGKVTRLLVATTLLLVALPSSAAFSGNDLFLPASGRVSGIGGSEFYTTVWVTNPGDIPVDIQIQFLPAGQANPNPPSFNDQLAPRQTKKYFNFVETLFNMAGVLGGSRFR